MCWLYWGASVTIGPTAKVPIALRGSNAREYRCPHDRSAGKIANRTGERSHGGRNRGRPFGSSTVLSGHRGRWTLSEFFWLIGNSSGHRQFVDSGLSGRYSLHTGPA